MYLLTLSAFFLIVASRRRPSAAASRRGIENRKKDVGRPKDLKVTGTGLSDSEGKAQHDSVKDTGGRHLMTTGTAQTVRRGGKTTAGDLTAKAKDRCGGTKVRNPQRRLGDGAPREEPDEPRVGRDK
ncbi:hypothetical protein CF326_g9392, partial [Tilletia indica]